MFTSCSVDLNVSMAFIINRSDVRFISLIHPTVLQLDTNAYTLIELFSKVCHIDLDILFKVIVYRSHS